MSVLNLTKIVENASYLEPALEQLQKATKLSALVLTTLCMVHALTVIILEIEINRRARKPHLWPHCPICDAKIESKGFLPRSILTLAGRIHWQRRVGRGPT